MASNKTTKSGKAVPLTREEQAKVAEACLVHGPRLKRIASEYLRQGSGHDLEDLTQIAAMIGVPNAVREFREDGGASFATLLNLRVRDALRTAVGVKSERRARVHISAMRGSTSLEVTTKIFKKDPIRDADSLDEPYDDGESLCDLIGEPATQEDDLANKELAHALDSMSDEDRALLQASAEGHEIRGGRSYWPDSEIAESIGQDRSWVGKRRRAATRRLIDAVNDFEPEALVA